MAVSLSNVIGTFQGFGVTQSATILASPCRQYQVCERIPRDTETSTLALS